MKCRRAARPPILRHTNFCRSRDWRFIEPQNRVSGLRLPRFIIDERLRARGEAFYLHERWSEIKISSRAGFQFDSATQNDSRLWIGSEHREFGRRPEGRTRTPPVKQAPAVWKPRAQHYFLSAFNRASTSFFQATARGRLNGNIKLAVGPCWWL